MSESFDETLNRIDKEIADEITELAGKDLCAENEQLQAANAQLRELLEMAASQLRYIGCFAGCDNGVTRNSKGEISQCQCCDEQRQISQALTERKGNDDNS